jgi:hypothetical protein
MPDRFLATWSQWRALSPPYIFPGDQEAIDLLPSSKRNCYTSWKQFVRDHDFSTEDSGTLHLGLLPAPFWGDIARARVVVLTLNPGVGPHDYLAEYRTPGLRKAYLANLRGLRGRKFIWLDPALSWHSGFSYWHGHLRSLIRSLAQAWGTNPRRARERLAKLFACIELCPYHSSRFSLPRRTLAGLRSVEMARSFAHEVLLPRAQRGKCLLIVVRAAEGWGIRSGQNVVVYRGPETRGARLTPESRGGKAILRLLSTPAAQLRGG